MKTINMLITGSGGQGVVLSSDMIGEVALAAGYDVKKTDIHGMAQRGGSVVSHVRIARQVFSPLSKEGEVDMLLGLEKLETARWGYFLKPGGIAIINDYALPPLSVTLGLDTYPSDSEITGILKQATDRIYFIEGTKLASELGDVRTLNILILGCASVFMPIKVSTWKEVISERLPEKIRQINLAAFERGRKEIQSVHL
ncbi:MAG: indolepyruvate oxidoreductase subunit beta [Dehalococcoidia bacterium]|nr:indolepyruvate oxidoreductase subunit beta [Dehalococcoidia bacterium]